MEKKYWDINDIIIILTTFFAVSTITQRVFPFSVNRIVGIVLLMCLVADMVFHANRKKIVWWMLVAVLFGVSVLVSEDLKYNLESYIYWMTTLFLLHKLTRASASEMLLEAFAKNRFIVKLLLWLYTACNTLFLFIPECYESYWGWGGRGYFQGYASTPHTLASASCLFITLACLYLLLQGLDVVVLIGLLVSLLSVFQSGARVFLISAVCIVLVASYILFRNIQYRLAFWCVGGAAFVVMFLKSGMMDKFTAVISNKTTDVLAAFTNARSTIWAIDLREFGKASLIQKIIGHGFDYVPKINQMYYGDPIWAHNDFVQLLLSVGVLGLAIYLLSIADVVAKMKCSSFFVKFFFVIYIMLPAFMNGLYIYQHLVYSVFYLWLIAGLYSRRDIYLRTVIKKGLTKKI
ncbi:MAG: hypothetical protein E7289_01900 [Lachnospiraceae bacterium]|nr:hypothetical protein [Lachnospiraceae bacterium]